MQKAGPSIYVDVSSIKTNIQLMYLKLSNENALA